MLEELFTKFYELEKQQSGHYSHEVTEEMNLIESQINFLMQGQNQTQLDYYRDLITSTNLEVTLAEKDLEYLKRKQKYYSSKITLLLNNIESEKYRKIGTYDGAFKVQSGTY